MAIDRFCCGEGGEGEASERRFAEMMGPGQVDQSVRQAIQMLWMTLPKERRTIDEAEREFRRLTDRAFRDMREDLKAFGLPG